MHSLLPNTAMLSMFWVCEILCSDKSDTVQYCDGTNTTAHRQSRQYYQCRICLLCSPFSLYSSQSNKLSMPNVVLKFIYNQPCMRCKADKFIVSIYIHQMTIFLAVQIMQQHWLYFVIIMQHQANFQTEICIQAEATYSVLQWYRFSAADLAYLRKSIRRGKHKGRTTTTADTAIVKCLVMYHLSQNIGP